MIDAMPDFPHDVADFLAECRDRRMTFAQAWAFGDLTRRYSEAEYGRDRQNPFSVESVLTFTKRHLQAAYEQRDTMRYCEEDCVYLALFDGHCAFHARREHTWREIGERMGEVA